MNRYRKRPVVIEAVQLTQVNSEEVGAWCRARWRSASGRLGIQTLEGPIEAVPGIWIIKGVKGEFYPCRNDIFEATYEPVEEPTP